MKKIITSLALATLATAAFAQEKTLEQRVEELELARDLNWIKWGGSLETRYDYIDNERNKDYSVTNATTGAATNYQKGGDTDSYYRMWANLNMEATPNDRLSFFGRLSMSKYFSILGADGSAPTAFSDLSDGAVPRSSALYLERAFANYKITDSVIFTMGRLPTIDGPNKHIALNQQLSGNYPTLAYSAILDGFALTKSFTLPDSQVLRTKFIYTPLQTVNWSGRVNDNGGTALENQDGKKMRTSSNFYSLLAEYEKSGASLFRKNLTIFQWVRGEQTPFYIAPTSIASGAATVGSDLEVSVDRFVLYSDFEKIFQSEFDFAVQGMYSIARSRGDLTQCSGNAAVCSAADPTTQGWNTDKESDTTYGTATAVTLRYQTPFKALNRPKIGAEWFNSTKTAYVYDTVNVNPINMYGTQGGSVYHAFYNQNFDGGLAMNVGYMYRKQKTTRELYGIFGDEVKTNNVDQNIYISLLATF